MTDDLDPKALDAAEARFGDLFHGANTKSAYIGWRDALVEGIATYLAALPVPDRGEMVEREPIRKARDHVARMERLARDNKWSRNDVAADLNALRHRLDAALGPATDQEREGT